MADENILVEKKDSILVITINRPEARNALSLVMLQEIERAFKAADEDDDVSVVIFTGAGDKAFSAGLDLNDMESFMNAEKDLKSKELFAGEGAFVAVRSMKKVVIAAVNGYAVTGGLELVLGCDVVIASETARFADTHARVGIVPGAGMTQILPRIIGTYRAKLMSFTGEFMDASEALSAGLASKVVPQGELMNEAMRVASLISSYSPDAVRRMKRMINVGGGLSLNEGMKVEAKEFADWKSGIKSEDAAGVGTDSIKKG
ncbi:MAG: enoyl-CoA hydratase [Deltaproteobacteria bacterium]|uniref:Enoyl-CoA hydratase n=1 Tax=Candidatus Zymogenus saltonus TaxID=2844893 RepID=A0A9D8PMA2_9DELT|nr:enoyl-CoA hydratase [Candidatus Zymogenus saltonus]